MGSKNKQSSPTMAELADRHICYEEAVQCAEAEIDIIDSIFKKLKKRQASTLREDFCGTTNTSCEWIKRRNTNTAICVDLDKDVLDWAKRNKIEKQTAEQSSRISLINDDVLNITNDPVDIVLAMNFSHWTFKERKLMIEYYKKNFPIGIVISATENANKFYGDFVPKQYIYEEYDKKIIRNMKKITSICKEG